MPDTATAETTAATTVVLTSVAANSMALVANRGTHPLIGFLKVLACRERQHVIL